MSFSLQDLEVFLPKDIVQKGLDYFAADRVDNLVRQDDRWEADVYGTDTYKVTLTISGEEVLGWVCNCPYDWGPVCKHVASVLFAIRSARGEAELEKMGTDSGIKQHIVNEHNTVDQIIDGLEPEQLQETLRYLAARNNEVRAYMLSRYAGLLPKASRRDFMSVVNTIIRSHQAGRDRFLDYQASMNLAYQLDELIAESAGGWSLVYLCEAVIVEVSKAWMDADDSSGSIGSTIDYAFDRLFDLTSPDSATAPQILQYLFEFAVDQQRLKRYDDFGLTGNFHHLAQLTIRDQSQATRFREVIEEYIKEKRASAYSNYAVERAELLKFQLLYDWESPETAIAYLYEHIHLSAFRIKALEMAWTEKRFDEVKRLSEEGIVQDTGKSSPGLVNQWQDWLIRYAEATGDQKRLVELTEQKYLEQGEVQYYRKLKRLLSPQAFAEKVEQYIQYFEQKHRDYHGFDGRLATIYTEENRLDDLMCMIETHPNLHYLDGYRELLEEKYQERYIQLYDQAVRDQMEQSTNRKMYRQCCWYLKVLIDLGGRENVRQIIADWKAAYPRRRAMLEEVSKVKV